MSARTSGALGRRPSEAGAPGVPQEEHEVQRVGRRRLEVEMLAETAGSIVRSVNEQHSDASDLGRRERPAYRVAEEIGPDLSP